MLVSMATTNEESAEQDGSQEDVAGGAVQALLDQGDDDLTPRVATAAMIWRRTTTSRSPWGG